MEVISNHKTPCSSALCQAYLQIVELNDVSDFYNKDLVLLSHTE